MSAPQPRSAASADAVGAGEVAARIAANSVLVLVLQALAQLVAFGISLVLARHLGPAAYGTYVFVFAFVAFFEIPARFGTDVTIVRRLAVERGAAAQAFWHNALALRFGLTVASAVAAAAVAAWVLPAASRGLAVLAAGGLLSTLQAAHQSVMRAGWRPAWAAALALVRTLLYGLLVVAVVQRGGGLVGLVAASVAATAIAALGAAALSRACVAPAGRLRLHAMRELLRTSWPLLLSAALTIVQVRLDIVLLRVLSGDAAVGLYGLSARLIEATHIVLAALNVAAFPALAQAFARDRAQLQTLVRWLLTILLVLGGACAATLGAFAAPIAGLFGPGFRGAAPVLALACWQIPMTFAASVLVNLLFAAGEQKREMLVSLLTTATSVAVNLALIPRWGALGAAGAALACHVVGLGALGMVASRRVGVRGLLGPALRLLAWSGALAAALAGLRALGLGVGAQAAAASLVGAGFLAAAWWTIGRAARVELAGVVRRVLRRGGAADRG